MMCRKKYSDHVHTLFTEFLRGISCLQCPLDVRLDVTLVAVYAEDVISFLSGSPLQYVTPFPLWDIVTHARLTPIH